MKITEHHVAAYNDKLVEMDYIAKRFVGLPKKDLWKKEFHFAAMRITDNGFDGYVITPTGEVFQTLRSKKSAIRVKGQEEKDVLSKLGIEVS